MWGMGYNWVARCWQKSDAPQDALKMSQISNVTFPNMFMKYSERRNLSAWPGKWVHLMKQNLSESRPYFWTNLENFCARWPGLRSNLSDFGMKSHFMPISYTLKLLSKSGFWATNCNLERKSCHNYKLLDYCDSSGSWSEMAGSLLATYLESSNQVLSIWTQNLQIPPTLFWGFHLRSPWIWVLRSEHQIFAHRPPLFDTP